MNKILIPFLTLLITITHFAYGQIGIMDLKSLNNTAIYKEGNIALRKIMIGAIRPPLDYYRFPEYCVLIGMIKISKEGEVIDCGAINVVDKSFRQQFKEVVKQIKGSWEFSNDTSDYFFAVIPIIFCSSQMKYETDFSTKPRFFCDYIKITVFSQETNFHEDKYYLDSINEHIKKEEYKKALKKLEILCARQPFNSEIIRRMVNYNMKINDTKSAEYYYEYLKHLQSPNKL